MEIFKFNIKFRFWGEVYLGLKKDWITVNQMFEFCLQNRIQTSTEERYIELCLAYEDSLFSLNQKIIEFILLDCNEIIDVNEDERSIDFYKIPETYWEIWRLEFLLKIITKRHEINEKLCMVAELFDQLQYPEEWKDFLYYQPPKDGQFRSNKELYDLLLKYIDDKLSFFRGCL